MWSSKLKPSRESAPPSHFGPDWIGWTGVTAPVLPVCIPVLDDGTLELDLAKHTQVTRIASTPLQYSELPSMSESGAKGGKEPVRVYVNQQGHTVKLARLAAPPPSHHVRSKAAKLHSENSEKSCSTTKTLASTETAQRNGTLPTVSLQEFPRLLEPSATISQDAANGLIKESEPDTVKQCHLLSSKTVTVNQKPPKIKTKVQTRNNLNSDSKKAQRSDHDPKLDTSANHPTLVKNQLDTGLKKIMADLAALNLPTFDTSGKTNNKQSHSFKEKEDVGDDCGKENDSPWKTSPDDLNECSDACKEADFKKPLSSRLHKGSFNTKSDTARSRDSKKCISLNSSQKTPLHADSNQTKGCSTHEKHRSYDPEKARAYIRHQKQERMNRLKVERERQQQDMYARRQKLDELSRTSLKLVKASIKRKPSSGNSLYHEDGAFEVERDLSNNTHVKKTVSESDDFINRLETDKKTSMNSSFSISDQAFAANIPLPLDDSNAQLIKDICEMKCKIEAMAQSLKTTLEANREHVSRPASNRSNSASSGPITSLQPPHGITSNSNQVSFAGNDVSQSELQSQESHQEKSVHPPYLHSLTTNLRKMRESLQSVLNQSEVRSRSLSGVSKNSSGHQNHYRHRRISSAGSDSAFETFKLDENDRAPSLDGHMISGLPKKKITTSVPSLQLAGTQNIVFDRGEHLRTSSETGIQGIGLNCAGSHSSSHTAFDINYQDDTKNSNKNKSDDNVSHRMQQEEHSDWFEPFTSKPYPANFISAVKRKLGGPVRSDLPPEDTPTSTRLEDHISTSVLPKDGFHQRSSAYRSLDLKSDLPLYVTSRNGQYTAPSFTALSASNDLALTLPASKLVSQSINAHHTDSGRMGNSVSLKSSMLDALNLEKMQADFVKALKPLAEKCGDITPAEKPLSAPNTPAKSSLKLTRPVFLEDSGKLKYDGKLLTERPKSSSSVGINNCDFNGIIIDDAKQESSEENHVLVPPNVSLASARLERKPGSVDGWISHSRGSGSRTLPNQPDEVSSASAVQENSSSRDTFEIGHVFNPTALHLQFQAELNILDSFNESLCQVMEVEKVCAVVQARQQALSEAQSASVMKEDKAIDVQTSLLKSNSEISSVNYQRGSGNTNDISLLDADTPDSGMKSDKKSNETPTFAPVNVGNPSPSSTSASHSFGSYMKETLPDSVSEFITFDERTSLPEENSSMSAEKSISEEINSMSDSLPEERTKNLEDPPTTTNGTSIDNNTHVKNESSGENLELMKTSNLLIGSGKKKKDDKAMSVDLSLLSVKGDSTFREDDAFFKSLQPSDPNLAPTLVSGEDMFQFTLQMLEQLMHEEELRVQHKNTLLKLRVKVLGEMARAEVANLDLDKKKLREKGEAGHKDQVTALRKKQRGIMLRFQQQREEIERLRRTEELAWQERRLMYLQQMHLVRMQISTRVMLHKFEKTGGNVSKKSRIVLKSIHDSRNVKTTQRGLSSEFNNIQAEMSVGVSVTQSSSVSMISLASDGSKSSAISNSSHKATGSVAVAGNGIGAGDSESSHLEEQVLKGLNELENRCRNLKEREKVLHERQQSVEQIIQWKRKLEEEEKRLRDVERQAHARHRSNLAKHMLRDRSTSPFQFLENSGCPLISNNGSGSRSISDLARSCRGTVNHVSVSASVSGSASVTEDVDSSIPEELGDHSSKPSAESTLEGPNIEQYANESFESELSEVKTLESQSTFQDGSQVCSLKEKTVQQPAKIDSDFEARLPRMSERSNKYPGVTIKVPLSPRLQRVQRRRYSSGSDDSMVLSQTETGSEQSDIEGRISALSEQLNQCKAEAERLRREAKRTRNERLIAKEQSLHKQLQAYENYICQLRRNLDAELNQTSVPIVRPQIKQPRVAAGKVASRRQDADLISTPGADRSVSHATSPDISSSCPRREEIETEYKETETISTVVSEAPSEIASEAASEIPSDVPSEASEVSENSSLVSQDAPSLVAFKGVKEDFKKQQDSIAKQKEKAVEALSDVNESVHEALPAVKSVEKFEDSITVPAESSDKRESIEFWESQEKYCASSAEQTLISGKCPLSVEKDDRSTMIDLTKEVFDIVSDDKEDAVSGNKDDVLSDNKDETSTDNKNDVTASNDQVKSITSITSEDEFDDVSEAMRDECGMVPENGIVSNVIRVFVREKEKETQDNLLMVVPSSSFTSEESKDERGELVDRITNEILKKLLSECLRSAAHTRTHTQDSLWDNFINVSLHEAAVDMISIYKRKVQVCRTPSTDVRKRVTEILAESQSSNKLRAEGRIKEMMTTTYGVLTPDDSPCTSPNLSSSPVHPIADGSPSGEDADTTYNQMAETSARKSNVGKASDAPMGLMGENVIDNEGVSQEWFDEDFGLTRSRREAEELRRQQLQIEQEIEHLQQQQAQVHEQIPYYYVREIPNKPPPPYTPPGQAPRVLSSSTSLTSSLDEMRPVCTDRSDILRSISFAVDLLYDARSKGLDVQSQEAPSSYFDACSSLPQPSHLSEQELGIYRNNARVYRIFLFDLAKELVLNAYSFENEDPSPPWLRPESWVSRRKALAVVPKTKDMLHDVVSRQVLVLFGFVPKASKENLTIRWSRKKRDHVDELLVRESQEEERQWTNYEQDEAVVKNNVALAILDSLLDDTVQVLGDVFRRREQRQHCAVY